MSPTETITVESVRRLVVNTGEVLVIKLPQGIDVETQDKARAFLMGALPDAKILITNFPIDLTVLAEGGNTDDVG